MDTCEATARLVNTTYRNVIEELGPCIKQLVVAGRTYLKSIHGMVAANRNYNEALSRVASMADNSTLRGSSDIGAALHHLVDINKEFQAQQSNIMKSLEFDFLEPMEIAADKDTKLVGREQKRFQQMHKGRKEAFEKSISTLKKSRKKKSINTDKQLTQMKLMESSKSRLEEFCDEGLKEAIVQERMMYGTVLERQCAFNKQLLIYHNKGCELLQDNIPHWEGLANTRNVLPNNCIPLHPVTSRQDDCNLYTIESDYDHMESPVDSVSLCHIAKSQLRERKSMAAAHRSESMDNGGVYARPLIKAKSEYSLSTTTFEKQVTPPSRFSRIMEYNGEMSRNYVRAIYPYQASGEYQMMMAEGDVIGFSGPPNVTGWQFGDNVTSKRSGWFPLSYTEPIKNGNSSPPSSRGSTIVDENYDVSEKRPLPPPPLPGVRSPHAKPTCNQGTQSESSEYGTLRKLTPRKLLPVEPPVSPVSHEENGRSPLRGTTTPHHDNTLPHRYLFQSDTNECVTPKSIESRTIYSNVPLQSMHL